MHLLMQQTRLLSIQLVSGCIFILLCGQSSCRATARELHTLYATRKKYCENGRHNGIGVSLQMCIPCASAGIQSLNRVRQECKYTKQKDEPWGRPRSKSRKMPGLLSSPVCLTVIWFLSWSLPPSRAQIWSDEVSDVQFGRLESNVTLACGKSQISVPVVWRHNHSSVLSWHQVTFNGSLVLFLVDQSAQGNYSCYDDSGLLLHSVILRLGYPPGLLSISCRVPNHTLVRCSWRDSVKTFLPAKYNTSFRGKEEKEPTKLCIVDSTHRHCVVQDPAFWQTIHTFGVTETNALGSQTSYHRIRLNELLKPDPPRSVFIEEVEGYPSKLWITWKNPSSWPEDRFFPLKFHIRYRPQGSMHWSEMMTEENSIEIPDATPHHSNQVQVRARDDVSQESQWSEWSPLSFHTPWQADSTTHPSDDPDIYLFSTPSETFTSKTHGVVQGDDGNLGLVILLVLFSIFILTTVLSLIFVIWMRQKRREHATKQELASMVKMKSMPI